LQEGRLRVNAGCQVVVGAMPSGDRDRTAKRMPGQGCVMRALEATDFATRSSFPMSPHPSDPVGQIRAWHLFRHKLRHSFIPASFAHAGSVLSFSQPLVIMPTPFCTPAGCMTEPADIDTRSS
jgi:hypothetical protein